MAEEYKHNDNPQNVWIKQLKNLTDSVNRLASIDDKTGASGTTTNIIAELEKITQNTTDLEALLADVSTETTLAAQKADVAEIKELSFANNGITVIKTGTTTGTVNFRGIQVMTPVTVVTLTGSNAGSALNGVTLPGGYHPVSGTGYDFTGTAGLAYLITE